MAAVAATARSRARAMRATQATRERVLAQHTKRYVRTADRYFAGFYRRVAPTCARVAASVQPTKAGDLTIYSEVYAKLGTYSWDQETRILTRATTPVILGTMADAWKLASSEVGSSVSFDLNARPVQSIIAGVGTRIRQVEDTSRERIARMIAEGTEKGLSVEQIVRGVKPGTTSVRGPIPEFPGIRGLVDSWTSTGTVGFRGGGTGTGSRSYLIAQTETANAYNLATIDAYKSSGVAFVEVFDGQDCGWSSHNSPDMAHGSIRSVEDAGRQPISHPRCQRRFGARHDATAAAPSPYTRKITDPVTGQVRPASVPGATPGIGAVDPLDAKALHLSGHEKVARPRAEVAEASQRQWERARAAEPGISTTLRNVTDGRMVTFDEAMAELPAAPGGDLAGYAARRKSLTSLSRKIEQEISDVFEESGNRIDAFTAAGRMGDTVRYTVRFTPAEYNAGVRQIVDELIAGGNKLAPGKWKPKWSDAVDPAYRGTNSNWIAPNGTVFEVQFHTPRGFHVKELNHAMYEEARLLSKTSDRYLELQTRMHELALTVDIPPGAILELEEVLARQAGTFRSVVAAGTVAPRATLDIFADDAVVAARARLDDAKRAYGDVQFTYGPARQAAAAELTEATTALELELRAAIARAQEAIRRMGIDEAKAALAEVRREIDRITGELATPKGSGSALLRRLQNLNRLGVTEAARLREVRSQLLARQQELTKRLPFSERVLPRPKRASRARDVYDEALAIEKALEEIFPDLPSAWTGAVKIKSPGRNAAAAFDWDQSIIMKPAALDYAEASRLKVLIHEMLHSLSPDLTPAAYAYGHGWEEGVIEGAAQMIEHRVRTILGRPTDTVGYRAYARFTDAFRGVQNELGLRDEEFWPELLRVPSNRRDELIAKWVDKARTMKSGESLDRLNLAWQKLASVAPLENIYGSYIFGA